MEHISNAFILFCFWCVIGWFLIIVRNSNSKITLLLFNVTKFKHYVVFLEILMVIFWPLAPFIGITAAKWYLSYIKRNP
jgi:hypothetical protein